MNRQIQVRTSKFYQHQGCIEHTPIYDLAAYEQKQKKQKFAKFRKKILESFSFCICVLLISVSYTHLTLPTKA